jgi:hypothetical protein
VPGARRRSRALAWRRAPPHMAPRDPVPSAATIRTNPAAQRSRRTRPFDVVRRWRSNRATFRPQRKPAACLVQTNPRPLKRAGDWAPSDRCVRSKHTAPVFEQTRCRAGPKRTRPCAVRTNPAVRCPTNPAVGCPQVGAVRPMQASRASERWPFACSERTQPWAVQLCPESSAKWVMVAVAGPCGQRAALSTGRSRELQAAMRRASFLCSRRSSMFR